MGGKIQEVVSESSSSSYDCNNFEIDGSHIIGNLDQFDNKDLFSQAGTHQMGSNKKKVKPQTPSGGDDSMVELNPSTLKILSGDQKL